MSSGETIDLISRIHDEFDRLGWRDEANTVRNLAAALIAGESPGHAAARVTNRFLLHNDVTTTSIEEALDRVLKRRSAPQPRRPALVTQAPTTVSPAPERRALSQRPSADGPPPSAPVGAKWPVGVRIAAGALIVIGSAIALLFGPDALHLTWLTSHPARLSLEWAAFLIALLLAGGVVFWRWQFVGAAVVAAIVAVIPLLGH
jgi:hypothetical protein